MTHETATATALTINGNPAALDLPTAAPNNPAAVYIASLNESSRRVMLQAISALADILTGSQYAEPARADYPDDPAAYRAARQAYNARGLLFAWHELRYQHTAALRTYLAEHYSASSAARMLAALRGVLKECWRLGLIPAEDYQRAVDLRPVKTQTQSASGRALTPREADRLISAPTAGNKALAARNRAIVATLLLTGMRRAEAAALRWSDIDFENGVITVRRGKGGKARVVAVYGEAALTALADWQMYQPTGYQTVFVAVKKNGECGPDRPLTTTAIYEAVTAAAAAVGIQAKPHDLRRTLITEMLATGGSLQDAQAQAGHASGSTTMRYAYAIDARKRRSAGRLRYG